jgi:hypothetical protein
MDRMAKNPGRAWLRLTACILVFALVLQGIAFTLAGARLGADAAGTADQASFELCRHDGGTAGGGTPESPAADSHCIFCLAGASCLDAPDAAPAFHTIAFAALSWGFSAWRLPAATVNASARSRGPPVVA